MRTTNAPTISLLAILMLTAAGLHAQEPKVGISTEPPPEDEELAPRLSPDEQIVPVAEEGLDEDEDQDEVVDETTVPVADNDEAMLISEFLRFKQLMKDGVYDEADTVAKRVVELAIKTKGPGSNELAKALTNLAIVQYNNKQFDAAQQNFESAIEIIEDTEDRLNEQLINPLKGLGAAQLESGRPDLATSTFRRAVHVTHVNEGPHNIDQVEILESLAETMLRMGELEAAKDYQDTIHAINIRRHDVDSMSIVEPLMRRAAWQHRAGFIYDERATYRRVIRIIEQEAGKEDLSLVQPLINLGKSYFFMDVTGTQPMYEPRMTSGEIYFKRAVRIVADHQDADWEMIAHATLALGDYYMFANSPQNARNVYTAVWNLLSEDEENNEKRNVRRSELESIVLLKAEPLPEYVGAADAEQTQQQSDDPILQGKISMTYQVSARGKAEDLKLIEAEPPEFTDLQKKVQRQIRRRVYRPRFENAEVVDTPDQLLVHTFFYRQSDLDALRNPPSDETRR